MQGHSGQNQGSSSHVVSFSCLRLCYQWMHHIFGCLYSFMWVCTLGFLQLCWTYCIVWIQPTITNKQINKPFNSPYVNTFYATYIKFIYIYYWSSCSFFSVTHTKHDFSYYLPCFTILYFSILEGVLNTVVSMVHNIHMVYLLQSKSSNSCQTYIIYTPLGMCLQDSQLHLLFCLMFTTSPCFYDIFGETPQQKA